MITNSGSSFEVNCTKDIDSKITYRLQITVHSVLAFSYLLTVVWLFLSGFQTAVHITRLLREITNHTWTTSGTYLSFLIQKCLVSMKMQTLLRTRRKLRR